MAGWFEVVRTDEGWHMRIKGGNGEIVANGEVLEELDSVKTAIDSIRLAVLDGRIKNVDERSPENLPTDLTED